jgi:hypothetical protein
MSWHYLQGEGEDFSLPIYLGGVQSQLARSKSTPETYSYKDNKTGTSTSSLYGMMSVPLTESLGQGELTLFLEGSLAKTSHQQELVQGLRGKGVAYGKSIKESLTKLNLSLSLLKTPLTLELEGLSPYSKTLTSWGMMQGGVCLGLGTLKHLTKGSVCGLWLPTPTCHNSKEGAYPAEGKRRTPTLAWELGGKINPEYTEWMMGWPQGWTDLKPLGMDRFLQWQLEHGNY